MDWTILILLFVAFGVNYLFIPALVGISSKLNIKDKTGGRKRHKDDVSMLGGIPIYLSILISVLLFYDFGKNLEQVYVLISFSLLFFTGIYDDLKPMNASKKFIFQIISAVLLVYFADIHHSSYFTFFAIHEELIKIISLVFIVFIINAYNLIDGINGLSAMLSIAALSSFGIWFYTAGLEPQAYVCFAIVGVTLAFLRFNLFNTKIFLGDNGSMLLGLSIAYFSTVFIQYNQNLVTSESELKMISPFGIAFATMIFPIMDTLRLFAMRIFYLEKSPFKADRNHLHHLLLRLGISHLQISFFLTLMTLSMILFAFNTQEIGNTGIIFILVLIYLALVFALDYFIFNRYRKKLAKKTVFNEASKIKNELNNPLLFEFIFALAFFVLAVSIPFHRISTSIPTVIVSLSFLLLIFTYLVKKKKKSRLSTLISEARAFLSNSYSQLIIGFLIFYTTHYLFNNIGGGNALSIKYLLLIYWLPVFMLRKIINIHPSFILKAYIYGCFGFTIFILYHALFSFHKLGWDTFFFEDLLDHVNAEPITHSLYFNLAILFIAGNFKYLKRKVWRLVHLLFIFSFAGMILLFYSKTGYLALALSLSSFIIFNIDDKKKKIGSLVFLIIIGLITFLSIPRLKMQMSDFKNQITHNSEASINQKLPRTIIWDRSSELIKENLLLGIGVGNSMNTLQKEYEKIGYELGIKRKFNCHNQFLETTLQTGVFGLILLCFLLAFCFYKAFKNKSKVHILFLIIVVLYMMLESLFETQMGMVAFAFFNALFMSSFGKSKFRIKAK